MIELPEVAIGRLLTERQLTLGTAESCTGGLIANRITDVAGSSAYFIGSIVSYSNEAKQKLLGVPPQTIAEDGAVSEETALAMARGAREVLGVDIAVSATGIAGPGGGSPQKPVGLVYLAIAAPNFETCERHVWGGDRAANKERSAEASLAMILRYLKDPASKSIAPRRASPAEPTLAEMEVTADGTTRPHAFTWAGKRRAVTSVGRQWVEDGERHVLVMTADQETFELMGGTDWRVKKISSRAGAA